MKGKKCIKAKSFLSKNFEFATWTKCYFNRRHKFKKYSTLKHKKLFHHLHAFPSVRITIVPTSSLSKIYVITLYWELHILLEFS